MHLGDRSAAGLVTIGEDVRHVEPRPGEYDVDIASPPCQTFSVAGKGTGRAYLDTVLSAVYCYQAGVILTSPQLAQAIGDERTALVLEPLRVALLGRSMFLAWEQVPSVLPIWEASAEVLRAEGYSVATAVLNAEQYGVPQRRQRAILVARRDGGIARLPRPTHPRPVSMAQALGIPPTALVGFPRRADRSAAFSAITINGVAYRARDLRSASEPAFTVTEKARSWSVWTPPDLTPEPVTIAQAGALQTFPVNYPFQGSRTKAFLQIGNAIPPAFAAAILRTFLPDHEQETPLAPNH